MTTPSSTDEAPTKSRRALLAGALGGMGAFAAGALKWPRAVTAADGDTVRVGQSFSGTASTVIATATSNIPSIVGSNTNSTLGIGVQGQSSASNGAGVRGRGTNPTNNGFGTTGVLGETVRGAGVQGRNSSGATGPVTGVLGASTSGVGVSGHSTTSFGVEGVTLAGGTPAVLGLSPVDGTGVMGASGDAVTAKPKTGVYGQAIQDFGSRGVWGRANAGRGVYGQATTGVGLYGGASSGYALRTNGRVKMDKVSGVANIPEGANGVTVSPGVNITAPSFVLLTPRSNLGGRDLWFTTNESANTFTIRISSSRTGHTKIAWLLLG